MNHRANRTCTTIKAGDLVMVVHEATPCPTNCNSGWDSMGHVFIVARLEFIKVVCSGCGVDKGRFLVAIRERRESVYRPHRLKRIPPLDKFDEVKRDEEITA